MLSKTPTFNLKVVLKETGLAADTLRAWERRYGLPAPERTAGGHRLYSQHDIETIKWLIKRQAEGLSISRAVELWKEQIASGSDPLAVLQEKNIIPPASMNLETVRRDWITACFNYDTVTAEQILNQAFAVHSIEITATEIIMRGLHEIGNYWFMGKASVQQEHFASGIAMRRLDALISASPPPTRDEVILLACPPNEWHAFPLLLTNLFLRRRGWNVVYLGANVPISHIEETIHATNPKLVILSAQTLINVVSLREMARTLNKKKVQTAFGGRVFNNISGLANRIPAHFLGNTIEYSIPVIESLIVNPTPSPKEEVIEKRIMQLADEYKQKRTLVEAALFESIKSQNRPIEYLDTAVQFLGDVMTAALELGSTSHLSTDMNWISNLLVEHNVSISLLPMFLNAYADAVQKTMGESAGVIIDWLTLEAQKLDMNIST